MTNNQQEKMQEGEAQQRNVVNRYRIKEIGREQGRRQNKCRERRQRGKKGREWELSRK